MNWSNNIQERSRAEKEKNKAVTILTVELEQDTRKIAIHETRPAGMSKEEGDNLMIQTLCMAMGMKIGTTYKDTDTRDRALGSVTRKIIANIAATDKAVQTKTPSGSPSAT